MTIGNFKTFAIQQFSTSPSPQLDAEVLLQFSLNLSKTQLLMNRDKEIPSEKLTWLKNAVEQRIAGLPIAYITGHKEFYGYDFIVSPDVLIPKPDTEILVEHAIELIIEKIEARPNSILTVCDMCTGSGCIALSVFKQLQEEYKIPASKMPKFTLVDISHKALDIAQKNVEQHIEKIGSDFLSRIRLVHSNLFEQVPWQFDVILTNPPYIPSSLVDELLKDGRNEPRLALDGDVDESGSRTKTNDGLDLIRRLIPQAKLHLAPYGTILMETGEYNALETAVIAQKNGFKTEIFKDLEDQLRVVEMK